MDDFIKKIFVACDKDKDGYLDRSDLEEVKNQLGLEGNITEIIEQFGAKECGKISFEQFCENSAILIGDISGSESSPEYYSTDSDTQAQSMATEKVKFKNVQSRIETATKGPQMNYGKESDLDLELQVSGEKIKQISESWILENHRKSGCGGIEDYLDPKTLQHLEELNIIDPHTKDQTLEPEPPPVQSKELFAGIQSKELFSVIQSKDVFSGLGELASGREKSGPDYMEISRQLHLAALASYKNEIFDLNSRLQHVRKERDSLQKQNMSSKAEKQRMQHDFEEKLQSQTMRITELQSVIAELTRKLNKVNGNTIIEEEEEEEDDCRSGSVSDLEVQGSCSECSSENCEHHLNDEGPNQVNFLATTHEMSGSNLNITGTSNRDCDDENSNDIVSPGHNDLKQQLSNVLGALESRIEDRNKYSIAENDIYGKRCKDVEGGGGALESQVELQNPNGNDSYKHQVNDLSCQVEMLKRDKRSLEKQLHNVSVQGYVYQKGNMAHVEEEFTKLRQENTYLRSKLSKVEQEVEAVKVAHITVKDEKDRLKRQKRALQESLDGKGREASSSQASSTGSMRHRSQSLIGDRPQSPNVIPRSNNSRSNSLDNHPPQHIESPVTVHRTPMEVRKYSIPSPASYGVVNSKSYTTSPENSLRHGGQHTVEQLSDLGSSIGDESYKGGLSRALLCNLRGRIPDTLLQTLMTYNSLDQILTTLVHHFITDADEKVREGLINIERVESRRAHLQSQNDLLQLSLDESKQNAERLSLLCGKYESNSTAWSLALQNTEQLIETYEVMLQLQESEADMLSSNCQVAGINNYDTIKSLTSTKSSQSNMSLGSEGLLQHGIGDDEEMLKNYHKRKDAESQAKMLLLRLDKQYENMAVEELQNDEASYRSRTSTGSSQNSACTDTLSKDEEHRLRHYIDRLKTESGIYKGTVVELDSVDHHVDENTSVENSADHTRELNVEELEPAASLKETHALEEERAELKHRIYTYELNVDIEAAVTLQELQALKEERAELKHRIYLLEKEKRALELKMSSFEAQEQAYIVHIEHLKSEVKEQIQTRKKLLTEGRKLMPGAFPSQDDESMSTSDSSHSATLASDVNNHSSADEIPQDLLEATRRERKLKTRIHELVDTLEKLSKNSERRHKETAEYISDLKRANGALVTAYEKAKKRHASRLKKFEQQLVQMAEKYQVQVRALKEQLANLKQIPPAPVPQTETSL